MRFDDKDRPIAKHGIIVVGASALLKMSVPLSDDLLSAKGANRVERISLLNMLQHLSQHGFEIIIPELVAFAVGKIGRNGNSFNDSFSITSKSRTAFHYGSQFLRSVPQLAGNIFIAPPFENDATPSAQISRDIARILSRTMSDFKRKDAIMTFDVVNPVEKLRGAGIEATYEYLRHMPAKKMPVFYLSENRASLEGVQSASSFFLTHPLVPHGIYSALQKEGLLDAVGIADVKFSRISKHTAAHFKAHDYRLNANAHAHRFLTERRSKKFEATLTSAKKDMIVAPEEKQMSPRGPSRVTKFNDKWGYLANLSKS